MPITRVQATSTTADNTTAISLAYGSNITSGNLLVILVTAYKNSNDAFALGDISKTAGTATLGSFTLDAAINFDYAGAGEYVNTAVYSAPVTGTGSCTIQVGGAPAGSFLFLAITERSNADTTGTRVEGTDTGSGTTGAPNTGNAVTSAAGALFAGIVGTVTSIATTHTKGADYT